MSSSAENKTNLRFEHLYALLRFDSLPASPQQVVVVRVFRSQARGQVELDRIAKLNAGKRCRYELQMTRLDEREA